VRDPIEAGVRLAQQLAPGLEVVAAAGRLTTWLRATLGDLTETVDRLAAVENALLQHASPGRVLDACALALADDPAAVLIDEAHHAAGWEPQFQSDLRNFLRDDQRIGVVVSSSERHALEELTQPDGPLEYVGQRFLLPPIAREDWQSELPKRFSAVGAPIEAGGLERLLNESRGHPFCTMWLARESARLGLVVGRVDDAIVEAALHIVERDEQWELRDDDE